MIERGSREQDLIVWVASKSVFFWKNKNKKQNQKPTKQKNQTYKTKQ